MQKMMLIVIIYFMVTNHSFMIYEGHPIKNETFAIAQ